MVTLALAIASCGTWGLPPGPKPNPYASITATATPSVAPEPTPSPTPTSLISLQKPGSEDYAVKTLFPDPLAVSAENPGPGRYTSLQDCVDYCTANDCVECRDWIQSIYLSLDASNQLQVEGKYDGVWLPTIDAVRDAVGRIPQLKESGVNTVSLGPDIVTREVETPRSVGDCLFRFYVRVFEDSGFNVHLVYLANVEPVLLDWAEEAEAIDARFFTVFNEVDGMKDSIGDTSDWLQEVLAQVRSRYSGIVCVQPTQAGFMSRELDYTGYDCVSSFFPLLVPDTERNQRAVFDFVAEAQRVREVYPSVEYVMFNDVATFSGGNWAETCIMEQQIGAQAQGRTEYCTEEQQAEAFGMFLEMAYPHIDGCFFNSWTGFTWVDRSAAGVVKEAYAESDTLEAAATDSLWVTPGLLEVVERVTLDETERDLIFDLNRYRAGWAGLCFEPGPESPGPLGCTSVQDCMECFRANPEEYWEARLESCKGE